MPARTLNEVFFCGNVSAMTPIGNSRSALVLAIGDVIAFLFSLVLTLTIRYSAIPGRHLLSLHLPSFSILFVLFLVVHFSAGLYDKQAAVIRGNVFSLLVKTQIINILIGIVFFYLAPVAIAPKANLIIFFVVSTAALFLWRGVMFPVFLASKKQAAVLVGKGTDIQDLKEEINGSGRYAMVFSAEVIPTASIDEAVKAISKAVKDLNAQIIVADLHNEQVEAAMPFLYSLIFNGVQVIDASRLYESVFDRIPLSMVGERWLVENSSTALGARIVYDAVKRMLDIVAAILIGIVSLLFYPFVYAAIKLEDKGNIFVKQERVGMNGKPIYMAKFRSMTADDGGVYNKEGKTNLKVTRVGKFIRLTRVDELPQLWSVIKGDQSLIGPRPELPSLVKIYEKEIPYYNARHLIKPGLSGWAQIYHRAHPHHHVAVDNARDKLSYDLYYVKNRSLMLDLKIALQTLKSVISKQGV